MSKGIISFGEILWDILPSGPVLGGAPLNFAYRLHCLGNEVFPVSRVGDDELGRRVRYRFNEWELPDKFLQTDPSRPTGTVPVRFENGQPSYDITRDVAYDYITATDSILTRAGSADCIYFGTLVQRSPVSHDSLYRILDAAPEALNFVDLNLRKDCYSRETVVESIERADIVKLSDEETGEVSRLTGLPCENELDFALALAARYQLLACIVTCGPKGALVADGESGAVRTTAAFPIDVVDTVGAGDAFSAGFVHSYLGGCSLEESCRFGHAMGALAAGKPGGTAPITADEIDRLLVGE